MIFLWVIIKTIGSWIKLLGGIMANLTPSQIQANMSNYKQQASESGRPVVVNERSGYTSHSEKWRRPVDERHYEVAFAHWYDVYQIVVYPNGTVERRKVGQSSDEERLIRITPEALAENVKAVEQRKRQEYEQAIEDYSVAGSQVERHSAILRAEQAYSFVTGTPSKIPEAMKANIANSSIIPQSINDLGLTNKYRELQYRVARGDISEDQANQMLQESVEEKLRSMPEGEATTWVRKYSISQKEQEGWHPETKVTRNDQGIFNIEYPYAAAQNYQAWKGAVESGQRGNLSWEDPLGAKSWIAGLQGNKQEQLDLRIKALYDERISTVSNSLTQTGLKPGVEFNADAVKQQWTYLLQSPEVALITTVISGYGIAKGLGYVAKAAPTYLTGQAAAASGATKSIFEVGAKWIPRVITGAGVASISWESTFIAMDAATGKAGDAFVKSIFFGGALAGGIYGGYKGSKLGEKYVRANPPEAYTQINQINEQKFRWDTKVGKSTASGTGVIKPIENAPDFYKIRYGGLIEGKPKAVMGEYTAKNIYMAEGAQGSKSIDLAVGRSFTGNINKSGKMFFKMEDSAIIGQVSATEANAFISRGLGVDTKGFFLTKGWGEISGFGAKELIPKISSPTGGSSLNMAFLKKIISADVSPKLLPPSYPTLIAISPTTVIPKVDLGVSIPLEHKGVYDIPISVTDAALWMPKEKTIKPPDPDAIFVSPPKVKSGWGQINSGYAEAYGSKESEDLYNKAFGKATGIKTLQLQRHDTDALTRGKTSTVNKNIFNNINDNILQPLSALGLDISEGSGSDTRQRQAPSTLDLTIQAIDLTNDTINTNIAVNINSIIMPFAIPTGGPSLEDEQGAGEGSFYPMLKEKQNLPYKRVNDGPFTREGALRYGGHYTGNSAKASFRLEPTQDKPKPLPAGIEKFRRNEYYYNKKKDTFVEKKKYRINSPGEIAEITAKGLEAQARHINRRWK